MNTKKHTSPMNTTAKQWYSLGYSLRFLLSRKRIFGWSSLLFVITISLTLLVYSLILKYLDSLGGQFWVTAPVHETVWGWITYGGWVVAKYLYLIISRIVTFYLSFLLSYSMTSPGYAFLSSAAEKIHAGEHFDPDAAFTLTGIIRDIIEGIKIALLGVLVTLIAICINFIPGLGQLGVFLLYTYYSALMFLDYPASRRRWSLGQKIQWLRKQRWSSFKIGVLPAFVSMVPLVNVFLMSLFFPLLTIHATLNFSSIELSKKRISQPQ